MPKKRQDDQYRERERDRQDIRQLAFAMHQVGGRFTKAANAAGNQSEQV
jgi:hypothetical protein